MNRNDFLCILFFALSPVFCFAQQKPKPTAYLFAYFTGNAKADESIHFALSNDGYQFTALNGNRAIISSDSISSTGGIRDPHILRGDDNKSFYMVATDMVSAKGGNSNRAMALVLMVISFLKTGDIICFLRRKGQERG